MNDCLFCKIFSGEIPSKKVYQDQQVIGFNDIAPQADIHLLFIHKNHHEDFNESLEQDAEGLLQILKAIKNYSEQSGLKKIGYRVATNIGKSAGQSVFHTHFHVLSSKKLGSFGT